MAKRSDLGEEIVSLVDEDTFAARRSQAQRVQRAEALSLLLAGLTHEQIAERLSISRAGVTDLIDRTLSTVENRAAEKARSLENQRLDRAQAAIWTKVLNGDLKAIDSFLKISARRARMNGLDEPTRVNLSINVRAEMEQALQALEAVVLGEVIDAVPDDSAIDD